MLEMVWLEENCRLIATDSGGVQKEAYFHGKPCVTLRDETEWVELIEGGYNQLVGACTENISKALVQVKPLAQTETIYGDGKSASLIVNSIL